MWADIQVEMQERDLSYGFNQPAISITLDFFGTSSLGGNRLCWLSNMRKAV
ncbi:MAG: hypothetical protein OJF50_002701 [Nitrospira sp.]|nr:hypothetical protein [Nitrospira sp.]